MWLQSSRIVTNDEGYQIFYSTNTLFHPLAQCPLIYEMEHEFIFMWTKQIITVRPAYVYSFCKHANIHLQNVWAEIFHIINIMLWFQICKIKKLSALWSKSSRTNTKSTFLTADALITPCSASSLLPSEPWSVIIAGPRGKESARLSDVLLLEMWLNCFALPGPVYRMPVVMGV